MGTELTVPVHDSLALLGQARDLLDKARTVGEVKDIRDKAAAIQTYAQQRGGSLELEQKSAVMRLEAERRLAAMLTEAPRSAQSKGGKRSASADATPKTSAFAAVLEENKISRQDAHRFCQAAAVPEKEFERYVARTIEAEEVPSRAGVIALTKPPRIGSGKSRNSKAPSKPAPTTATGYDSSAGAAELDARAMARIEAAALAYYALLGEYRLLVPTADGIDIDVDRFGQLLATGTKAVPWATICLSSRHADRIERKLVPA